MHIKLSNNAQPFFEDLQLTVANTTHDHAIGNDKLDSDAWAVTNSIVGAPSCLHCEAHTTQVQADHELAKLLKMVSSARSTIQPLTNKNVVFTSIEIDLPAPVRFNRANRKTEVKNP